MVTPDPTDPDGAHARVAEAFTGDDDTMYDEVTAGRAREHVKEIIEQAHRIPAGISDEDRTAVLLAEISERANQLTFTTIGEAVNPSTLVSNIAAHPVAFAELLKDANDGAIVALLVAALDLLAQREPVTR